MWRRHINLQRHWNLENLWWGCLQCMWKSWYFYISTDVFQEACIQKYFCLVCNPTNVYHLETNQTCIQKEVQNLVRACEEFPSVHPCSRFNNVFCEECNIDNVTECSTIVYREKKRSSNWYNYFKRWICLEFPFYLWFIELFWFQWFSSWEKSFGVFTEPNVR